MIVKETKDIDEIKSILLNDDIYATITDDNDEGKENFEPPIDDDHLYIGGYDEKGIFAVLIYHSYLDGNECHVQVLPSHRASHAIEFGKKALMFKGDSPLYAEIPECYSNVLEFAELNDFERVGLKKNDYLKNKIEHDTVILKHKGRG